MKKRPLRKSDVLREGYDKGLREALSVINEMMVQTHGFEDDTNDFDDVTSGNGARAKGRNWGKTIGNDGFKEEVESIAAEQKELTEIHDTVNLLCSDITGHVLNELEHRHGTLGDKEVAVKTRVREIVELYVGKQLKRWLGQHIHYQS